MFVLIRDKKCCYIPFYVSHDKRVQVLMTYSRHMELKSSSENDDFNLKRFVLSAAVGWWRVWDEPTALMRLPKVNL